MATSDIVARYASRRLARRVSRSVPWIGSAIAVFTLAGAIRRKGMMGGTAHTVLDFVPFVGAVKNVLEMRRGSDFFPDRRPVQRIQA